MILDLYIFNIEEFVQNILIINEQFYIKELLKSLWTKEMIVVFFTEYQLFRKLSSLEISGER